MVRLCDILNGKVLQKNSSNSKANITSTTWEFIESLFISNSIHSKETSVHFIIQTDGKVFVAVDELPETETDFNESNVLSCIEPAINNGLSVAIIFPEKQILADVDRFITFTFNPSI